MSVWNKEKAFLELYNLVAEKGNVPFDKFFPTFRNALWSFGELCGLSGEVLFKEWMDYLSANNLHFKKDKDDK